MKRKEKKIINSSLRSGHEQDKQQARPITGAWITNLTRTYDFQTKIGVYLASKKTEI